MALNPGETLGPYEILERIGQGGMGEVYRARDPRVRRDVAIKISAERFSERFATEARAIAALNHPNVCTLHDVGPNYLVMELVEGRAPAGPLPLEEALGIARQIAAALEAAHEKGVVHRDLKPDNIRVRPDGSVKVLDFGLAKRTPPPGAPVSQESGGSDHSPTLTMGATQAGMIVGTASYMSPEQARGKAVDKRADIWSFGVVLYELVTGRRPFTGEDASEVLAAVIKEEPSWDDVPESVRRLVRRCLAKKPAHRLRDIGDAALEIDEALHPDAGETGEKRGDRPYWGWIAVVVALVALGMWWFGPRDGGAATAPSDRAFALSALVPDGVTVDYGELPTVAISPDARWLAFIGFDGRTNRVYLRPLGGTEARPVADSEGGTSPFFSPDSHWLAFLRGSDVLKVPVGGGAPVVIGRLPPVARGFEWNAAGKILFARSKRSGLYALDVGSGGFESISTVNPDAGGSTHNWVQQLPGGRELLVTMLDQDTRSYDDARLVVMDPEDGSERVLVRGGYRGRLLPGDILVYVQRGTLFAVRVDTERWEAVGQAVPVLDGFMTDPNSGAASLGFSSDGVLAYAPGGVYTWQSGKLVWIDREGKIDPVIEESRPIRYPNISPDGTRVAFTIEEVDDDIWVYEFARGTLTRLTFQDRNMGPVWRPRFDEICYSAIGIGESSPQLYIKPPDGRSPRRRLLGDSVGIRFGGSWSPDGMTVAFMDWDEQNRFDIMTSGEGGTAEPRPFAASRFAEYLPRFSPDGKWIAYTSDESGKVEVYLQPFPGPGVKRKVSEDGGTGPTWRGDGAELFYLNGERLMAVDVELEPDVSIGRPHVLFEKTYARRRLSWVANYDVSADGQRFLMIVQDPLPDVNEIRVVQDWFRDLEAQLDAAGM